ncbi:MAG: hypothetical protein EXS37_20675 [Opitutus sp.]|nr:hypothetical protein [Opitutus sp.]
MVELAGAPPETLRAFAGIDPDAVRWAQILAVFAEQGNAAVTPPMAGAWHVADGRVRFTPRFPLEPGVRYRAEFRAGDAPPVVSFFEMPADTAAPTTVVTRIFPSAAVLPENQLKFYVHFSAPMSRGGTYEHVHLRDAAGQPVELPFLELDEELWDPSMTRLTLLIDPGRIKRGVKPLEDIGPVFEEGKNYALTLGVACRDAAGRVLRAGFEKRFRAGATDRTAPDPRRWKVSAPAAGTRAALVVEFDEPMDQALALRLIHVVAKADGVGAVDGVCALAEEERRWTFVPESPWTRGRHELTVGTTIEDLAGNNIGKTFDVDLEDDAPRQFVAGHVSVVFEVR